MVFDNVSPLEIQINNEPSKEGCKGNRSPSKNMARKEEDSYSKLNRRSWPRYMLEI
jgi:hypothetical protein